MTTITPDEVRPFVGHLVSVELPPATLTGRQRRRFGHLEGFLNDHLTVVDRQDRRFKVPFSDVVRIGSSTDGSEWPAKQSPFPLDFEVRGVKYALTILDDGGEVPLDPTLLLFREDEEVAIMTVHLDPKVACSDSSTYHVTAPAEPLEA